MRDFRWRRSRTWWLFLLPAAACLASGAALAQSVPITDFIVVQPISVCSDTGTLCAPFNTTSTNGVGNPSNTDQTTNPIGFVDPITKINITRALLNQIGIDVTFNPIVPLPSTALQTLNVTQTTNAAGATIFQSQDFLTLSQQPAISNNPNPPYTPKPPLASNVATINLFFVNKLNPPSTQSGGTLYGFSWIRNNGVAIGANTFGYPRSKTSPPPRPDTIAHELGHNLGLDHFIFGAGPVSPCPSSACDENLMTTGSDRQEPNPAIDSATNNCTGTIGQACWVSQISPARTLANGGLDLMTLGGTCTPTTFAQGTCTQQSAVLDPSGLLNPLANSTTTVTKPGSNTSIDFSVTAPINGRPGETLIAWILMLPQALTFDPNNKFRIISQSRRNLLQDVDLPHPDSDVPFSPCATETALCLEVEFNRQTGQGFGAQEPKDLNTPFAFSQGILNGNHGALLSDLCGAKVTYIFSEGYITTSAIGPAPCSGTSLAADSQNPDPTTPPQISTQIGNNFVGASNQGCTVDSTGKCSDPTMTGVSDANPSQEGGQCGTLGQPLCQ